jgi:outer membrane protein OmpA-like peptidoglycan-associated protein
MRTLCLLALLLSQAHVPARAQELHYTVLFNFNRHEIPDTALLQLVRIIHGKPVERILIEGHCDSVGSKDYNDVLSKKRSREVAKLFTDNGIEPEFIRTCIGYGKDRPLNENQTEAQRQLNRRADITFYLRDSGGRAPDSPAVTRREDVSVPSPSTPEPPASSGEFRREQFEVGKNIVLRNMYFWGGRHVLKPESYPELGRLLRAMQRYPGLEIEIEGHVCCTTHQPDGYDWDTDRNDLSVARARAVYNFLVENGIEAKRLSFVGYGGSRKINEDEFTEELRAVNRRVEIKVLKF